MGFSHFRCEAPFLVVCSNKFVVSAPRGVNGTEGSLGSSCKSLVFPSPPSKYHAAYPSHLSSPMGWPAQPVNPCQPTATPKCQPRYQPSPRAAVSISLLFHVGRRVQFHFRCTTALLTASLSSPPFSLSASWVRAFHSAKLCPSVA